MRDPLSDDSEEDPDNDYLNNIGEYHNSTDPNNPDTDGDGYNDGFEIDNGYDPLDPTDHPQAERSRIISSYNILILTGLTNIILIILIKKIKNKK